MNWDAAGAIGEIVGAVAVVISILYLAIQIRSQTREARLTATRELARDYRHVVESVTGDDQLFAIYQMAMKDYDALSDEERVRIHLRLFSPLFGVLEQQFLHLSHSNIDPIFLNSIKKRMADSGKMPGIRMWWERNRDIYSVEFQKYVDDIYLMESQRENELPRESNSGGSPSNKSVESDT